MVHANACLTPKGRTRLASAIVDDGWTLRRVGLPAVRRGHLRVHRRNDDMPVPVTGRVQAAGARTTAELCPPMPSEVFSVTAPGCIGVGPSSSRRCPGATVGGAGTISCT